MFAGKKSAQIREILISESAWEEMTCLFAPSLGLGDGPNDAPLLEVMDYAVIVKGLNRQGVHLHDEDPARVWRTQREGPEGWREGLDHFFSAR